MSGRELTEATVAQLAAMLAEGSVSARELLDAHLERIHADGEPSFDGRPDAVNPWVRLYEEDAIAAAERLDSDPRRAPAPGRLDSEPARRPLHGIPIGLKDLYAGAGKPLTASSRAVALAPEAD